MTRDSDSPLPTPPPLGLYNDGGSTCFIPSAMNVTAHVVNDSSILVSWDTTRSPEITCDMSRQFQVQILTYDSYEKVEKRAPDDTSEFQRTEGENVTEFLVQSLNRTKYYIFKIQNRYNLLGRESNTATSKVFFFGTQGILVQCDQCILEVLLKSPRFTL